jgi:hypothetical protein
MAVATVVVAKVAAAITANRNGIGKDNGGSRDRAAIPFANAEL